MDIPRAANEASRDYSAALIHYHEKRWYHAKHHYRLHCNARYSCKKISPDAIGVERPMPQSYIKSILDARVYDVARETPIHSSELLSRRLDNRVWLKREDLQPVFSCKLRGAYCKMSRLSKEQLNRGVIAASAGNHAQGVAMAARTLAVKATIVMPRTTPLIKVDAVRNLGAKVVLHGDSYDEAALYAEE